MTCPDAAAVAIGHSFLYQWWYRSIDGMLFTFPMHRWISCIQDGWPCTRPQSCTFPASAKVDYIHEQWLPANIPTSINYSLQSVAISS